MQLTNLNTNNTKININIVFPNNTNLSRNIYMNMQIGLSMVLGAPIVPGWPQLLTFLAGTWGLLPHTAKK